MSCGDSLPGVMVKAVLHRIADYRVDLDRVLKYRRDLYRRIVCDDNGETAGVSRATTTAAPRRADNQNGWVWISRPDIRMERCMKSRARTAIMLFGGAAVLALAVGCAGSGGNSADPTTPSPSPSVASTPSPSPTKGGCIGGLNC
jgi:hypothetical protein